MKVDYSSLAKALASLEKGIVRADLQPGDEELRDACIQRFEYTFELCWKMLKRRLEIDIANKTEVDSYSKRTLFRVGAEMGFIKKPESWFEYLELRNLTSHTYDSNKAKRVYSSLANFIADARDLLTKLELEHDQHNP